MTRALSILLLAFALVSCAPQAADVVAAQNTNPVVAAQAQAANLQAITAFMDAAAAREQAKAPDYGFVIALVVAFGIPFGSLAIAGVVALVIRYRTTSAPVPQQVTNVTNNYLIPVTISPMGRIIPLAVDPKKLEAGQNVTAQLAQIEKQKVK